VRNKSNIFVWLHLTSSSQQSAEWLDNASYDSIAWSTCGQHLACSLSSVVGVFDDNAGTLAFYRSAGFGDIGKTKPELSTKDRTMLLLATNLQSNMTEEE